MKGDFTRFTHNPKKHYTRVLKQQGRVDLDADWNEHADIQEHLRDLTNSDLIGSIGVPAESGGFKIGIVNFLSCHFSDKSNGWVVGDIAGILRIYNSENNWKTEKIGPPANVIANLESVRFADATNGFAVGDNATVLRIYNFENSWKTEKIETPPEVTAKLRSVRFADATNGFTVGDNATVLRIYNFENNWKTEKIETSAEIAPTLESVSFADATNGFAVGNYGTVLRIYLSGTVWKTEKVASPDEVTANLQSISFADATSGFAVGDNGTVLRIYLSGTVWKTEKVVSPDEVTANLQSICFADATSGFAVGDNGTVLRIHWSGTVWKTQEVTTEKVTANFQSIVFADATNGFAVGDNGTVLRIYLSGTVWKTEKVVSPDEVTANLQSICFADATSGFAIGDCATILHLRLEGTFTVERLALSINLDQLMVISKGRIYADGILAELDHNFGYWNQPDYPNPESIEAQNYQTHYLVYLDIWQRHITAIEDPYIREVALGGPDTTTRVKTVWQVKVMPDIGAIECTSDNPAWDKLIAPSGGLLSTGTAQMIAYQKPCEVALPGGYQGRENRLYRVEIHTGGSLVQATFKWSRDNGSVVFPIEEFDKNDKKIIRLKGLGKDQALTLKVGDWVEVSDDASELSLGPGTMAEVKDINRTQMELALSKDLSGYDGKGHPKVRRWDQKSDARPVSAKYPIDLEDGIQIQFSGGNFKAGDYWVFAARTATNDVEELVREPPLGIKHHYCRLAVLRWSGNSQKAKSLDVFDCRHIFPSLTDMVCLFYVGGDGQEAMPGYKLGHPLQVGVSNGKHLLSDSQIAGMNVEFKINPGEGDGQLSKDGNEGSWINGPINIPLDDGIATCYWKLGASPMSQQVEARLIGDRGNPVHLPIRFTANLSVASEVAYDNPCTHMNDGTVGNVRDALNTLCKNYGLHYVGGSGQQAPAKGELDQPLKVRVSNGIWTKANAKVNFNVIGGGNLTPPVDVFTDADGIATCSWTLGSEGKQLVEATLRDDSGLPVGTPIFFNADIEEASGTCCLIPVGVGGKYTDLSIAINELMLDEQRKTICLCLLPGEHNIKLISLDGKGAKRLHLEGCDKGAEVILDGLFSAENFASFTLKGIYVKSSNMYNYMALKNCKEVRVESCHMILEENKRPENPVLEIGGADHIQIRDSILETYLLGTLNRLSEVLGPISEAMNEFFKQSNPEDFEGKLNAAAKSLKNIKLKERISWVEELSETTSDLGLSEIADGFLEEFRKEKIIYNDLKEELEATYRAALELIPAAVVINDCDADTIIENNTIKGDLCFYGKPDDSVINDKQIENFKKNIEKMVFSELGASLRLNNSNLTHISIGTKLLECFENWEFSSIYRVSFIAGNCIASRGNQFVTKRLLFSSNSFTYSSEEPAGLLISEDGTFVGNHAQAKVSLNCICKSERLKDAANLINLI